MDTFTQALEVFGPWDWACVGLNLFVAIAGLAALKCWRNLPAHTAAPTLTLTDAVVGLSTGLLAFAVVFGLVTHSLATAFSTHFGISQAHMFTAVLGGQLAATLTMLGMGLGTPQAVSWAPLAAESEKPAVDSPLRQAFRAFRFSRVLLALLSLFALGLAASLTWKGVHFAWEQCFLQGWSGQPPADEPQEIVDAVLKTDVNTWRFATLTLAVTIGAPLMEELAFRGMIYPSLRQLGTMASARYARAVAVILTGALFSYVHLSPSAALPLFAFGAFMCLVRDRYGLLTCIAVHSCFNLWNLGWLKLAPNASTL